LVPTNYVAIFKYNDTFTMDARACSLYFAGLD